ncbi:MAG TPA: FixH family protein [Kofleriaceae bacterium]
MTPRLKWLLAIAGLLVGNVIAMVILAVVAGNGRTQVIPAYYDRAAHFDDEIARASASRALGWHAEVAIAAGAIDVTVSDAAGHAVDDARVRVTGYQRAHAGEPVDVELVRLGGGHYRAGLRERRGWHDLTVAADRGDAHYQQRVAVEAR